MNKVVLIGRLTKAPENSTTANGISVTKLNIAVNRNYTNANGEKEVDFINIVAWRALADVAAKYLNKGDRVGITGSMQTRTYKDENDKTRYVTEVIADEVEFLESKKEGQTEPKQEPKKKKTAEELLWNSDEDLPF